jgi:hypothetical protein
MRIEIPIYFNSKEQQALADLDIELDDIDWENADIETVVFYNINAITQRSDNNGSTTIYSNGETWVSPLSLKEIEAKIK